jgi:hypothetical protein
MPYRTVTEANLRAYGFSRPASASCYYPDNSPRNHIHLGVPTTGVGQGSAGSGNRYVTFISLKVNDATVGRVTPDANGYFDIRGIPTARWPTGWRDNLRACLGGMINP